MVRCRTVCLGEAGLDFETCSVTARQRPNGGDTSAGDEDCPYKTGLERRHDQATARVTQILDAA